MNEQEFAARLAELNEAAAAAAQQSGYRSADHQAAAARACAFATQTEIEPEAGG